MQELEKDVDAEDQLLGKFEIISVALFKLSSEFLGLHVSVSGCVFVSITTLYRPNERRRSTRMKSVNYAQASDRF